MAEIVEVIHRINYEVNDAQLQGTVKLIHAQIQELNDLYHALGRYQRQLAQVRDTTAFSELSRKVDGATRAIEASLGKTKGILAQFGGGLLKGLGLETDLEAAVVKWLQPLNEHLEGVKNKGNDTVTSLGGIAANKRKENQENAKETYQTLAKTAVDAFNTIYEAQVRSLDKEISLRKERVEQATRLAEKGNVEQLALEQERLAKAEAARDKAAQKQLQLNALMQASNSAVALTEAIGAVVGAASKGDPYTIALRVAAAVAALVAGIAAVSTAFGKLNGSGAYADGVIDFKGLGGPRDDANLVRISSGESVITAKGTAANRSILEAINKGAEFKMLNGQLLQPSLAAAGAGAVSKEGMKLLEKKLDSVIEAVKDSKLKQDIFFNEQGVGLMTQRVVRRDQNRFK